LSVQDIGRPIINISLNTYNKGNTEIPHAFAS
jgi:hypothetical protein